MYPFARTFYNLHKFRNAPKIGLFDPHVSHHYCLPWDIDLWMELNNGRTLTLFDLGRISMGVRNGYNDACRAHKFGMAVAGASVRYRKRVTTFERIEMVTRPVGFDDRFIYIEQSMWNAAGDCANHLLLRGAVLKNRKMVPPAELLTLIEPGIESPALPAWVQAWSDADTQRPWPPERL